MILFSELFTALDTTTSTNAKVDAMAEYFSVAPKHDIAWAIYLLSGRRLKRLVTRQLLQQWLSELSGYPLWMVKESYTAVGDFAETASLLAPDNVVDDSLVNTTLSVWMEQHIQPLAKMDEAQKQDQVMSWWQGLPPPLIFLVTKLITGALRVGVSNSLVAKAVSQHSGIAKEVILHRLMGEWKPTEAFAARLTDPNTDFEDHSRPYPFFLASPITEPIDSLGEVNEWLAEWKWDGIRAQLIKRDDKVYLWSRGEELITERFPEITNAAKELENGTVLDGEILPYKAGKVLSFNHLQKRLGRKTLPKKLLEEVPVKLLCYDCIEYKGEDCRVAPLHTRRTHLKKSINAADPEAIDISETVPFESWQALTVLREQSRRLGVEGFMLKRADSPYETGRKRGHWWKWKVDPLTVDAVMLYAQAGHGRRANLFTDYTFAVWQGEQLLPLAKAYSGLNDKEINRLDKWIRANTTERFGPVRSVKPLQVFELAFEGINLSKRHKSGVALRFPRILRWREDLSVNDADTLEQVKALIEHE